MPPSTTTTTNQVVIEGWDNLMGARIRSEGPDNQAAAYFIETHTQIQPSNGQPINHNNYLPTYLQMKLSPAEKGEAPPSAKAFRPYNVSGARQAKIRGGQTGAPWPGPQSASGLGLRLSPSRILWGISHAPKNSIPRTLPWSLCVNGTR